MVLERCLKQLYYSQNSDSIIRIISQRGKLNADAIRDVLYQGLTTSCGESGYTYDQCGLVAEWFAKEYGDDLFRAVNKFNEILKVDENDSPYVGINDILRWNNLSAYLTEDLLVCTKMACAERPRTDFEWEPYVPTDSKKLNDLLGKPLADVHSHLKGSSFNFEINWICLMNHIAGRKREFEKLESWIQSPTAKHIQDAKHTLYEKAIIAAAIRLMLFCDMMDGSYMPPSRVIKIIKSPNLLHSIGLSRELQISIDAAREKHGRLFKTQYGEQRAKIDYAVSMGSPLSGERRILYNAIRLRNDKTGDCLDRNSLLYLYLVIKNEIRKELVQTNDAVGFGNFDLYEGRKTLFIEKYPEYEHLLTHLSVESFFGKYASSRRHEARIAPKSDYNKFCSSLVNTEKCIQSGMFGLSGENWKYAYDYHFIKSVDRTPKDLYPICERHHCLREEVKQQALNIARIRNGFIKEDNQYLADKIVGIDAANSEILCRPEVFAQAYRFLREHKIEHPEIHEVRDLGITYHVGEDFVDIVDGLRSVAELILYMNYRKGDRLGHALVLGVDVKEYYAKRNYSICMTRQMLLDNIVWLHHELKRYGVYKKVVECLESKYKIVFEKLFKDSCITIVPIATYYKSWLLRGDSPFMYNSKGEVICVQLGEWNEKALNCDADSARQDKKACKLYYLYHYDAMLKKNGQEMESVDVDDAMISAISFVQSKMLRQVENLGLCIECNPTSNFKIGEIEQYDQHPISKFFSYIKGRGKSHISSSINTDDKGIFATSIEREYALVYAAFKRKEERNRMWRKCKPDLDRWMDDLRQFSNGQCFVK